MSADLLRKRVAGHHARVTYVELFFDLVFVFAVTQLSHGLLKHLTLLGALETGLLFLAVWWTWVYTAWATNWLDPERRAVRLMLFVCMLLGLVLSTSLPDAFGERGLIFAGAFVALQVGRALFVLWGVRSDPVLKVNFQRISIWTATAGAVWIAGGLAEGPARLGLWLAALAFEFAGPASSYRTPGLGRSSTHDWNVEGGHFAERFALFMIICLGESILVTGATFAELGWSATVSAAFFTALVGSIAMWWIYFSAHADMASDVIAHSGDSGRIARLSYTYLHIPMVAGVIVAAAGDELVLAHPAGHMATATAAALLAGPALFLAGALLFKRSVFAVWPLSRIAGLGLLVALTPFALQMSPLALSIATTAVLLVVCVWEGVFTAKTIGAPHGA
jgi:low temperature requirement protein LtrA